MICEKCHTKLEKDEIVCKRCGTKINSRRKKSSLGSFSYNKKKTKNNYSDQDLLEAYVGKNYEKFQSSFSIPAAILGPFYCIYRKQWPIGITCLIIYLITYHYLPENLGIFIRLLSNIIIAIQFNNNYIETAKKRIIFIKEKEKTLSEQLEQCEREGKTINIVLWIVITVLFFSIVVLLQSTEKINLEMGNNLHIKNNQLSYTIPEKTIVKANYINYQHLINKTNNKTCYMTISSQTSPKTAKEYLLISGYEEKTEEIEINQIHWYHSQQKKNSYEEIYITKTEKNNMIYELHFSSPTKKGCSDDIDILLNSATID